MDPAFFFLFLRGLNTATRRSTGWPLLLSVGFMSEDFRDQPPPVDADGSGVREDGEDLLPKSGPDGEAPASETVETVQSAPLLGRGALAALLVWGLAVLAFAVGGLADGTNLWWLVLVFGAVAPIVLVALRSRALGTRGGRSSIRAGGEGHAESKERELLGALKERGELTPTVAAMHTTLTVGEAAGMLEKLARRGHLEAQAHEGTLVYALRERDRRALEDDYAGLPAATVSDGTSAQPLLEPLSARDLEVLRLLADGGSNREVSQDLHVALGTVKAHAANIYRKLEARNRAEAVARARKLGLLRDGDRPL